MNEKDKAVVNFANKGRYGGNWDGTKKSDPQGLIESYVLRVEEKNKIAESEWNKIKEAKKAQALADEKAGNGQDQGLADRADLRLPNGRKNGIGPVSIATRVRQARESLSNGWNGFQSSNKKSRRPRRLLNRLHPRGALPAACRETREQQDDAPIGSRSW
mmetsp:Transcript_9575/g.21749  ORF Transcript_9575/g.21749 Transcript_9575/m.21749 type:complete len:160 (-) Transcript_9575:1229-1708(-)